MKKCLHTFLILFICLNSRGQIANYINNGSFEQVIPNVNPVTAKHWLAIDSSSFFGKTLSTIYPPMNAPLNGTGYQWPRTGSNYFGFALLYDNGTANIRGYPKNRLKRKLETGATYCVKFYCSITNSSTHGVDGLGAYFGDTSLDTISYCTIPLTYILPQIHNPDGNVLTDTLNWFPITGTFVATGNEKYMIIGNFKSDAATNTLLINPSQLPTIGCDILIDDVSCMDINLPALAGRDTVILPGSTVFLGREPDIGIDEACIWYKLPDLTNPIDTIAGFTINPTSTSTYVVRQQLTCSSSPKWDTVVITVDPTVGNSLFDYVQSDIRVFPNPASDFIELKIKNEAPISIGVKSEFNKVTIYNSFGQLVREEAIGINSKIKVEDLTDGVYFLELNSTQGTVRKRFVIAR